MARAGGPRTESVEGRGMGMKKTLRARLSARGLNALGILVLVVALSAVYFVRAVDHLSFHCTIRVDDPRSGLVDVMSVVSSVTKPILVLQPLEGPEQMRIRRLRARGWFGLPLPVFWHDGRVVVVSAFSRQVTLEYAVEPGANGRHGHQGTLSQDFVLVPGRILFFVPARNDDVAAYAVRLQPPAGWVIAQPWSVDGEGWLDPRVRGGLLRSSLESSSLAMGRFTSSSRTIGGNQLEIHTWAGWPDSYERRVADRATGVFEALQKRFHFVLSTRFVVVFVPRGADNMGVIAAYWSNGLGNDMDDSGRAWSLFAHRLAHVLNRDEPDGMHLAENARWLRKTSPVNWVNEGVAAALEVELPLEAGITGNDGRWGEMWSRYVDGLGALSPLAVPAAKEHETDDPDVMEYLHYAKAPIIVQNLDQLLRGRSDGKKSVPDFVASLYARYGHHRGSVPFFEELDAYAGFATADFFERNAVSDDVLLPLWNEVLERTPTEPEEIVADVNGEPVRADQRWRALATDQEGRRVQRDRLIDEAILQDELKRLRPAAIPARLLQVLPVLPPSWKRAVVWRMRDELARALAGSKDEVSQRKLDAHLATVRASQGLAASLALEKWRDASGSSSPAAGPPAERTNAALAPEQGNCALKVARRALTFYLETGRALDITALAEPPCAVDDTFAAAGASFVTLTQAGKLRGCIGSLKPKASLWRDVSDNAGRAARHDQRFPPLDPDAVKNVELSVSVVGSLREVRGPEQVVLGRHGLVLSKAGHQGVFLPEVPIENGWGWEATMTQLSLKAGLPGDAWRSGATLSVFDTQRFSETSGSSRTP